MSERKPYQPLVLNTSAGDIFLSPIRPLVLDDIEAARDRCLAAIEVVKWQCLAAWLIPSLVVLYAALWV